MWPGRVPSSLRAFRPEDSEISSFLKFQACLHRSFMLFPRPSRSMYLLFKQSLALNPERNRVVLKRVLYPASGSGYRYTIDPEF